MNDAPQIRRWSGALRAIHLLLPAPHPKTSNRERRVAIHQNASSRPRKLRASPKNKTTHPSVLLRLKPTPILCFVGVTGNFNRTMLRLYEPFSTPENTSPMQTRRKKNGNKRNQHPSKFVSVRTH